MPNITTYDFIDSNRRKTILLMALFPVSLVAIVYLVLLLFSFWSAPSGNSYNHVSPLMAANQTAMVILPIVSVIAILWILITYFYGQNFILSAAGAVELNRDNAKDIIRMVENLTITAGLPMPKVYAINDEALNAFATGRDPDHSYIVLTKGIINKLEKPELEGVIAHELSHIGNRDIRLMLIMIVCISAATIAAEFLLRFAFLSGRKSSGNKKGGNGQLILFALAIALYIYGYLVAPLIQLAVSRTREFQADASAALLTRNPQGLADALRKISGNSVVETLKDRQTMSAMCISNPLAPEKRNSFFAKISGLYATHPPIEERIKALMTMDGYRE
ncbi:MAG: M48 family metallopeptidase [Endomicrobia bacterium]|nr:M48 family metallopeptidase [Endomicrobiia bacterium]